MEIEVTVENKYKSHNEKEKKNIIISTFKLIVLIIDFIFPYWHNIEAGFLFLIHSFILKSMNYLVNLFHNIEGVVEYIPQLFQYLLKMMEYLLQLLLIFAKVLVFSKLFEILQYYFI